MRVVFVRHGKQIGTGSRETERDKWDPPLSTQGHQQAELLARHLAATEKAGGAAARYTAMLPSDVRKECLEKGVSQVGTKAKMVERLVEKEKPPEMADAAAAGGGGAAPVCCVTSPMRRALQTAAPSAAALGCRIVCHGALFEYGCAGLAQPGTSPDQLRADCPQLEFAGFSDGLSFWDYQGTEQKENEPEARLRAARFSQWLQADLLSSKRPLTVVVAHQTYMDLLLRLLLEPETGAAEWRYGANRFKWRHTACAELRLEAGKWSLLSENDARHLERFDEVMEEAAKAF